MEKKTKFVDHTASNHFMFNNHTAVVIVLLAIICLSMVIANATALNFTVICMAKEVDGFSRVNDTSLKPTVPMFTDRENSWLFSAVAMGAILGTFPIAKLNFKYGARKVFSAYGAISALSTLFLPLATEYGFYAVFAMRFVVGIAFAMTLPASGIVVADWASIKRSGTYVALLSCHLQLGPIIAMPLSGMLCSSSLGWPAVYYILGFVTAFFFAIFYGFYRDSPELHRNVSQKELEKIQDGKVKCTDSSCRTEKIPYSDIFLDPAVLGCLMCSLGSRVFALYGPSYLSKVLHLDMKHTGFMSALPSLIALCVKVFVGPASDRLGCLSPRRRVQFFATLSQFAMASCFIGLGLISNDQLLLAQALFIGVTVFNGINAVGATKSMQLIGGRFASVLMSLNSYINSAAVLLVPHIMTLFAPNGTPSQWSTILIAVGALVIVCVLAFDYSAAAEARYWSQRLPMIRKCGTCQAFSPLAPGAMKERGESTSTISTTVSSLSAASLDSQLIDVELYVPVPFKKSTTHQVAWTVDSP